MRIEINLSKAEYAVFQEKIIRIVEANKIYSANGQDRLLELIDTDFGSKGEGRIILTTDTN